MLLSLTLTLIVVSIKWTLDMYISVYKTKEELNRNELYNSLVNITDNGFYKYFLAYTGFETGYGFYAPNIGDDFITESILFNSKDSVLAKVSLVPFKDMESLNRMNTALSMFSRYKSNDTANLEYKKCNLLLKRLATVNLRQNKKATKVKINLYLYHHPTVEEIRNKTLLNPYYVLYTSKVFTAKNNLHQ